MKQCGFHECTEPAGHGRTGRFCEEHAQLLGGVRDRMEDERARLSKFGHDRTRARTRVKRMYG